MKNKHAFLKNILTTTSLLAITLTATDAMGAGPGAAPQKTREVRSSGDQNLINNNSSIGDIYYTIQRRWEEGYGLKLTKNSTTLSVVSGAQAITNVGAIDLNGKTAATLNVGANTFSVGNIRDSEAREATQKKVKNKTTNIPAIPPKKINVNFNAATSPLKLIGTDYSALGNIKFADISGAVQIGNNATINSAVTSTSGLGTVQTLGNARIGGSIGASSADSSQSIQRFEMDGTADQTVTISAGLNNIYAKEVVHNTVKLGDFPYNCVNTILST